MNQYVSVLYSSLWETVALTAVTAAVSVVVVLVAGWPFLSAFGLLLLLESTGLMLVGGAMSFVTPSSVRVISALMRSNRSLTNEEYARANRKAALLAMTGVLLFAESLLLAFTLG